VSVTVATIYARVTEACLENGGFVLGLYTEAQFLHDLADVMLDFTQRAPLYKRIFTTMVNAGVPDYLVPDNLMQPQLCFVGGKLIEKVTETDLALQRAGWQRQSGPPAQWYEDDVKRLRVYPTPDYNGANIPGDAPPIGKYDDFYPSERNLTMVGPAAPSKTAWLAGDTLDTIPDSFTHYLVYGVLEKIFGSESEMRDVQRAAYCHTRFEEGISLAQALVAELMEEE
jgi:hypothetical protein